MTKDDAMKILRETHNSALFSVRTALETMIPELKESEEEKELRIVRTLISLIKDHDWVNGATKAEVANWILMKRDPGRAPWSEADESMFNAVNKRYIRSISIDHSQEEFGNLRGEADWLQSLHNRFLWKPMKGQMAALRQAIAYYDERWSNTLRAIELSTLLSDLEKLEGE